jgi:hypothetical protein
VRDDRGDAVEDEVPQGDENAIEVANAEACLCERETLVGEHTTISNRIKATLRLSGLAAWPAESLQDGPIPTFA